MHLRSSQWSVDQCWELSSRTLLAEAEKARRWTAPTTEEAWRAANMMCELDGY
jgi:hypothetical protein